MIEKNLTQNKTSLVKILVLIGAIVGIFEGILDLLRFSVLDIIYASIIIILALLLLVAKGFIPLKKKISFKGIYVLIIGILFIFPLNAWISGIILIVAAIVDIASKKKSGGKEEPLAVAPASRQKAGKSIQKGVEKDEKVAAPAPLKPVLKKEITSNKIKTLERLIKVSTRVKIDDMVSILDIPRRDLMLKLLDIADQYHFKIEEDVIAFEQCVSTDNFVKNLEEEFATWGKSTEKVATSAPSGVKICPKCQEKMPATAKFCNKCGMQF